MTSRYLQGEAHYKFLRWNEYEVASINTSYVKIYILSTYETGEKGFSEIEIFKDSSKYLN
jgi:hypothetical protein